MTKAFTVLMFFCITGFGGCGSAPVSQETAEQAVYAVKATYATALKVAVTYKRLPRCGTAGALSLCSDPAIILKVQNADNAAFAAIKAMDDTVRTKGFADSLFSQALIAARGAVAGFVGVTSTLTIS